MQTRTGNFPIGFRRGWSDWQKDLSAVITWAKANNFAVIDLGRDGHETAPTITAAGLDVGSVDLLEWQGMLSADPAKRADAAARNAEYVAACAGHGIRNFFIVMLPEDPALSRADNFGYMVAGLSDLLPMLEQHGARLVIEGWPGPGALCCTPEGCRALFRELPSPALGINYDPSHLVRLGIDYLRFLDEFGSRVYHVHGKDTEILAENQYEYGTEQPPTFAQTFAFGSMHWRYTIPGQGLIRWGPIFARLSDLGYSGAVSIELEDANFNGTEAGEKAGLLLGAHFLAGC